MVLNPERAKALAKEAEKEESAEQMRKEQEKDEGEPEEKNLQEEDEMEAPSPEQEPEKKELQPVRQESAPARLTVSWPATLGPAQVGKRFSYSFCRPDRARTSDLCGSSAAPATNPSGGRPPYHFELDSGVGFPPFGINLNLNGLLEGTPDVAGESTFRACAVDLAGNNACKTFTMTVNPAEEAQPQQEAPKEEAPSPPPPPPEPETSVSIGSNSCRYVGSAGSDAYSDYHDYEATVSGTLSGPVGADVSFSIILGDWGGSASESLGCGSWSKSGDRCKRMSGQSESAFWSVRDTARTATSRGGSTTPPNNYSLSTYIYSQSKRGPNATGSCS
jgi:hypothetical protein